MPSAKNNHAQSVVIVGGGAAGLMTAFELSKHKIAVTILESKQRLGGRIHTLYDDSFSQPVETGAEFIHGHAPVTLSLLNEAGISYHAINDTMGRIENGVFNYENNFEGHWNLLMKEMVSLQQDMPLAVFIDTYFGEDKYAELRSFVKNFAGGFDLADISTASTKALYREWSEEMGTQYRVDGGYKRLIDFLETKCRDNGCSIHFSCCAKKISWHKNEVNVLSMCSHLFKANKIVIAVPVSVLQADAGSSDYIEFSPAIPQHIKAAKNIGFGAVIKVILEFHENFWKANTKDAGMIFMQHEVVPTWWTQSPVENNILTGWIGNEHAKSLQGETDEVILYKAIQSLANSFGIPTEKIHKNLKAYKIANWCKEPDIYGGYSFSTVESATAKNVLRQPVNDTIFFSGEALFEGSPGGTVEAALSSGRKTAEAVLKTL
ncbi:flavin monoamine oxidase family protein [Parafilimonas terrae]|uniref:Tryptophan 2-monooxygenase n=1 Tax=Parafilimonas terrae TaxID=1465490 RepID=A0A1I5YV67_9BACT|nr:NAD(P)/FAD-dependent oxidoreductase [Parafilimonas terrae]SFQ48124.1 monoamine oxidase [Parafilimonas terrae]